MDCIAVDRLAQAVLAPHIVDVLTREEMRHVLHCDTCMERLTDRLKAAHPGRFRKTAPKGRE